MDFTIINPYTLQKQGFEFSPWSTHGYLSRTKEKNQKEINLEARANFEKEMQKHKEYYRKFNIFTLIYTDSDLQNLDQIFEEMHQYYDRRYTPKVKYSKACASCSLKERCLPKLEKAGSVKEYLKRALDSVTQIGRQRYTCGVCREIG